MSIREYSKLQFKSVSSSKTTRDDSDQRNRQWYYRCANFEKSRTALHHHVPLIPSAYRLSKSSSSPKSGPLQYFHPLVKEDSAGWMQRCTQYFANFSPRLTCLIHSFFQERFGVDVYGRKPCAHRVSRFPSGEMALCQLLPLLLPLLFLVVVLRTFDTSTAENERKTKKVCCGIVNFSCRRAYVRLIGFVCVSWIVRISFSLLLM